MGMTNIKAASGVLVRDGIWILALTKADPETQEDAPLLAVPQDQVLAAMDVRKAADKAAIEAGAVVEFQYGAVRRALVAFGTKAFGHFLSRKDEGYLRLLPKSPTELAGVQVHLRAPTLEAVRKAVLDKATPKELQAAGKDLIDAIDGWQAAVQVEAAADEQLRLAMAAEKRSCDAWHTGIRKLRGRLIERFPRDPKRVASYFPKRAASTKAKAAVPEPA